MNGKYIQDLDAKQIALDHAANLVHPLGLTDAQGVVDAATAFYAFLLG